MRLAVRRFELDDRVHVGLNLRLRKQTGVFRHIIYAISYGVRGHVRIRDLLHSEPCPVRQAIKNRG